VAVDPAAAAATAIVIAASAAITGSRNTTICRRTIRSTAMT
jgi:hypothetical protein